MASVSTKRRRTTSNALTITDLPIGFLVDVSSYLSKPSRAIFAVAISASSSSWKKVDGHQQVQQLISDSSKAIIAASDWDTLDFADIERNLAERLTDDNLHAILCIAIQSLRILKLTNCTNFIGDGLKPLQSSTVLELIDLSLKGKYEKQETDPWPRLRRITVLPILHNIIATEGCSLKYVMLSPDWFSGMYSERTREFLQQFTQVFRRREYDCSKCGKNVNEHLVPRHGLSRQRSVCYNCLKVICDDCHRDNQSFLYQCTNCKKDYCKDCEEFIPCRKCGQVVCGGCKITCQGCENSFCQQQPCLDDCDCQRMQNLLQAHW